MERDVSIATTPILAHSPLTVIQRLSRRRWSTLCGEKHTRREPWHHWSQPPRKQAPSRGVDERLTPLAHVQPPRTEILSRGGGPGELQEWPAPSAQAVADTPRREASCLGVKAERRAGNVDLSSETAPDNSPPEQGTTRSSPGRPQITHSADARTDCTSASRLIENK